MGEDAHDVVFHQREAGYSRHLFAHDPDHFLVESEGGDQLLEPLVGYRDGIVGQECDELATGESRGEIAGLTVAEFFVRDLVEHHIRKVRNDTQSAIGRSRIDHHDLYGSIDKLARDRLEDTSEVGVPIEGEYRNGRDRAISH